MRKWGTAVAAVVTSALAVAGAPAPSDAASSSPARQTGKIVSKDPVDYTPDILGNADNTTTPPTANSNTVYSIARVGDEIVVGGRFTQVVDNSADGPHSGQTLNRQNVFAFDATTGEVSDFDPSPTGVVNAVQAGRDGQSVYLGGAFGKVRPSTGAPKVDSRFLAKFTLSSGELDPSFTAPALDGQLLDIESVGTRLWVAGRFTTVGGVSRPGIAALNTTSGELSPYFDMTLSGIHNPEFNGARTFVKKIAVNPSDTAMVAVGNFSSVDGEPRYQVAKFSLGSDKATLSPWTTPQFYQQCSNKFETNMTDVSYSPGGSYFVISTTGAYGGFDRTTAGTSGCDVVARFPASSSTSGSLPTWTAYTGGDTTWTVEVTDNVIYVGGHMRWENNPTAGDAAGQGAVSRTGIAALDPVNGLPYSWNPTRQRGVGVQDMLATDDGLYIGSDTERLGNGDEAHWETHKRIAMLPLGDPLPPVVSPPGLPASVYTVRSDGKPLYKRRFTGTKVTSTGRGATGADAPDWSNVTGAFMIAGNLYTGHSDGSLTKQTFNGTDYGAREVVATGDEIVPQTDWHNGDVPDLTSIFYYRGFLYFTLAGGVKLYRRAFEAEDELVGQLRSWTKLSKPTKYGAFVAGGKFFFSGKNGYLQSMRWGGAAGPTGKATVVSGPSKRYGSQYWNVKVAFVYQAGPTP